MHKPKLSQLWLYCLIISTSTFFLLTATLLTKPYLKYRQRKNKLSQQQLLLSSQRHKHTQCLLIKKNYQLLSHQNPTLTQAKTQSTEKLIINLNKQHYQIIRFEQDTTHSSSSLASYTLTLDSTWPQFIHLFNCFEKNWIALNIKQITLSSNRPNNTLKADIQFEETKHHA